MRQRIRLRAHLDVRQQADKSHAPPHRLQGMNTRHAVIDSPLGELTLVAEDDALTGVYFRHHWYRRRGHARSTGRRQVGRPARGGTDPADRLPRRRPHGFNLPIRLHGDERPAARLESADHHPLRRDHHLRGTGRGTRRRHHRPGSRPGRRPQSAEHRRSVPSRGRRERPTDRIRGRARNANSSCWNWRSRPR